MLTLEVLGSDRRGSPDTFGELGTTGHLEGLAQKCTSVVDVAVHGVGGREIALLATALDAGRVGPGED